jgi:long-chain acyl-CoA synthetase
MEKKEEALDSGEKEMRQGMEETILGLFLKVASDHEDLPAFNYFDQEWKTLSYRDFLAAVQGIASSLMKSGVQPGSRIALLSESRFEWCASYLGILMAGGVAVPIDAELGWNEIERLLTDSGSVLLFHSEKTRAKLLGRIKTVNFDSDDFRQMCRIPGTEPYPLVPAEDVASIVYTSGTTGTPKGVMLTQKNLYSDVKALINFGIITRRDNLLAILPFHHTYPFMCTFLLPICSGAQVTFPLSLKGPELLATIREKRVTVFMGVPRLLEVFWNRIMGELKGRPRLISALLLFLLCLCSQLRRSTGVNLGKWIFGKVHKSFGAQFRFFTSGGAKLDPRIIEDFEGMGLTILEGYGLTETSPVVAFNPVRERKAGSAGKPLPSVEVKIITPSEAGEGEIAIRGPMVMKGYYKNPEATAQVLQEGWFLTGDLGTLDEDGYLYITGRKKEVIVLSSGKNVYPEEVEKEYLKIPLIKEMAVVARTEEGQALDLYGVIVPNLDYARSAKIGNIREALRGAMIQVSTRLPAHNRVKGFRLHPGPLPRTPLGKLRRYALEDLLKQEPGEPEVRREDKELLEDAVGRKAIECIVPLLKRKRPILSSDHLELDLGFDSLQRIELMVALEKAFLIELPDTIGSEAQTVGELVALIKGMIPEGGGTVQARVRRREILSAEPSEAEKKEIGLAQGKMVWSLVVFMHAILRGTLKLFFSLEVKGIEHIPEPPFIITPNHCSNIDGFVVGGVVPLEVFKKLYFQGYRAYFANPLTSLFARIAHVISIDPETHLMKALQLSSYVLGQKRSLCIFPEGGRSPDGELTEFKKGVIVLAKEHHVPLVPVRIRGTFEVLPRGAKFPRLRPIHVIIGAPLRIEDLARPSKPEGVDEDQFLADALREKVKSLK